MCRHVRGKGPEMTKRNRRTISVPEGGGNKAGKVEKESLDSQAFGSERFRVCVPS